MTRLLQLNTIILATALVGLVSCKKSTEESESATSEQPAAASAAAASPAEAEAAKIFQSKCTVCHGMSGKGDGPGAAALDASPRNYTDTTWQKSVTDDAISNIIVKGGAAVGKNAAMPPNPDLASKPDVVAALVKKIRSFSSK